MSSAETWKAVSREILRERELLGVLKLDVCLTPQESCGEGSCSAVSPVEAEMLGPRAA